MNKLGFAVLCLLMLLAPATAATTSPFVVIFPNDTDMLRASGSLVYEGLVGMDSDLQAVPGLATGWEVSSDELEWTFYIRHGVQFHDGSELTAEDVAFSLSGKTDSGSDWERTGEAYRVIVDDKYTVSVKLEAPDPYFLNTVFQTPIIPSRYSEESEVEQGVVLIIGTGPYQAVEWDPSNSMLLKQFHNYWGSPAPFEQLVFKVIFEPPTQFAILQEGEADLLINSTRNIYELALDDPNLETFKKPSFSYLGLFFNLRSGLFSDLAVRKAVALAIDYGSIVNEVYADVAAPCGGPIHPGHLEEEPPYPRRDLEAASELLLQAGWYRSNEGEWVKDGARLEFSVLLPAGLDYLDIVAEVIRADLAVLGIPINIVKPVYPTYLQRLYDGEFDSALVLTSTGVLGPDLSIWRSGSPANFSGYSHPEVDQLISELERVTDPSTREAIYRIINGILVEEAPCAWLVYPLDLAIARAGFVDIEGTILGFNIYTETGAIQFLGFWCKAACYVACVATGAAVCASVATSCVVGSVVTVGCLVIPCTTAIIAACAASTGFSAVCCLICDEICK